ncbi:MAG TPA: hypothetical protein VHV26_09845 [Rhizomicrobium sp.]|jgi:hypothetical protein|nr:hypothetical protein [Rhizomicrobium sp.]
MRSTFIFAFALLAGATLTGSSRAEEALAGLTPLSETEMMQATGGEEPFSISLASNQASVSGNQIGGIGTTGTASGNGLTNNSGLTTLIANTGNQVVISQSTVVNVFLH